MDQVHPEVLNLVQEGMELDSSIKELEGYLGYKMDDVPTDRRSSSCQSYTYIPVKTFKRFISGMDGSSGPKDNPHVYRN